MMKTKFKRVIGLLAFMVSGFQTYSCTCNSIYNEMNFESYFSYDLIVKAKVVKVEECGVPTNFQRKVQFQFEESYKGSCNTMFTVLTSCNSSCAMRFEQDSTYLIYAQYVNEQWEALYCSYTRKYVPLEVLDQRIAKYASLANSYEEAFWVRQKQHQTFLENVKGGNQKAVDARFSNGQLCATGTLASQFPVGEWTFYYPSGEIRAHGTYNLLGQKVGLWQEYELKDLGQEALCYLMNQGIYDEGVRVETWTQSFLRLTDPMNEFPDFLPLVGTVHTLPADSTR